MSFGLMVESCFTSDAWPLLVGQRNLYIHCSNVRWLAVVSLVVRGAFDSLNCIVHAFRPQWLDAMLEVRLVDVHCNAEIIWPLVHALGRAYEAKLECAST